MIKFGKGVVICGFLILILAFLLLIPSAIGYMKTRINYDILSYLPGQIETMKGQDALHPSVSPEQFVDLIIASVSGMELADADSLGEVRQALLHMVQRMAEQDHEAKNK